MLYFRIKTEDTDNAFEGETFDFASEKMGFSAFQEALERAGAEGDDICSFWPDQGLLIAQDNGRGYRITITQIPVEKFSA